MTRELKYLGIEYTNICYFKVHPEDGLMDRQICDKVVCKETEN